MNHEKSYKVYLEKIEPEHTNEEFYLHNKRINVIGTFIA